jgi:HK97 family phage major capsid protein
MKMSNQLVDAIEKVAGTFEEFKRINEDALDAAEKKHAARAAELAQTLDKISGDLSEQVKQREIVERKIKAQQERIEIMEALSDRPRGTVQDKAKCEWNEAFVDAVRKGFNDMEANHRNKVAYEKAREVKAVNITTAIEGGYAVPEEISRAVEALLLRQSGVMSNVKMVQVGTSDYKELVSIHGTTSGWAGEATSRSETGVANLRERAPTWGELYAYPKVSNWALEDLFFDVSNWLVNDAAEGMAKAVDAAIYNGNGSSKPTGIFAAAPTAVADYNSPLRAGGVIQYVPCDTKSPQAVNADDIIDLVYTLAPGYRANAKFYMNSVTQGFVRKLKDSYGQYLWAPSLQVGQPDRLLGYEVVTWEDLANPTTADGFSIVFGDMRRAYLLVSRSGLAIDRDPYTAKGYTSFYMRKRYGGIVLNNDSVKALKLADT